MRIRVQMVLNMVLVLKDGATDEMVRDPSSLSACHKSDPILSFAREWM